MSISNISTGDASAAAYVSSLSTGSKTVKTEESTENTADLAAVYEKSTAGTEKAATYSKTSVDREAIISQLKADADARNTQLQNLVSQMMSKQGLTLAKADDMWSFLASGDFTVDADTKAQAQADVAEDGYWGAEQTSDRILSFAKALAGDDSSKASELLEAFKKGYSQATGTWGKELPDLSKQTYSLVEEKFNKWINGEEDEEES